ncbi:glycosyltransferase [Aquiflexum sp. TKW24L]|uniref:glycosyltransferase n=1 Tax=Aquiflexum sp. TKW24L TaxID=2942212 RepID=UPI0020BF615E|nr:glycosyltransferase [Aquiflexum sp. TKW24L]MCL6260015.1 glycosyltransferase [Aquiflexum sp. TKW24L]
MKKRNKVLLISYDFPPVGGGGVQRNLKFLKYLNRFGWDTSVLTVKNREYYVYDYTLLDELENKTSIFRTSSLDPSFVFGYLKGLSKNKKSAKNQGSKAINEEGLLIKVYRSVRDWLLIPDGYGGWIPFAFFKGLEIIKSEKPDVLLCTFPYVSNAFVTYFLHLATKTPYVIDFRDGWIDDPYTDFPSNFHRKFHAYFEKKVLYRAKNIVVFGEIQKEIFQKRYPNLQASIYEINNGYDPEDLEGLQPIKLHNGKLRIVYSGAVYRDRKDPFISFGLALNTLEKSVLEKLEVVFVGDKQDWSEEFVVKNNLTNTVFFTGYLPHLEALNILAGANCSLMFLRKGDFVALTGKIFEYIGVGLPIIACVEPEGECAKLLKSIDHAGGVCAPDDVLAIKNVLEKFVNGKLLPLSLDSKERFSRKSQAFKLSGILQNSILNEKPTVSNLH